MRSHLGSQGQLLPGFRQWIMLVKMGMKSKVGERLETGGIISHHVGRARDVVDKVAVAMGTLVIAGELADVGSWARGRDRSLLETGHSGGVVTESFQGGVANLIGGGYDIQLSQDGRLF